MDKKTLRTAVGQALRGSGVLIVSFGDDFILGVPRLLRMVLEGQISLRPANHLILLTVVQIGSWGLPENKTVQLTLTTLFDKEKFIGRMVTVLDRADAAVSDRPRKRRKEEEVGNAD